MRLAKIDDYYIDPDNISYIKKCFDDEVEIYVKEIEEPICVYLPIKKVLDAIYGSEEHLEKIDRKKFYLETKQ